MKQVFAIDVGGVLANKQHEGEAIAGALEAVKKLYASFRLEIVSQCGAKRAADTPRWLQNAGFSPYLAAQTYIGFKKRKTPVLAKIGARYFIDDRLKHVIPAATADKALTVFWLSQDQRAELPAKLSNVIKVKSWDEVMKWLETP